MFLKGFSLSLNIIYEMGFINYSYYYFSAKFQPIVREYIQSEFINSIGLGITIFFFTFL